MDDIEETLDKHKGIIMYMANKYRFLDERDDLVSWGYIGFLDAWEEFKKTKDIDLSTLIFQHIKKIYIKEYFDRSREMAKRNESTDRSVAGKDGDEGSELVNFIAADSFHYSEQDIYRMVDESLFECDPVEKQLIIQYYLYDVEVQELCEIYGKTISEIRKITRRGYHLILRYLINNNFISEWATKPTKYTFTKQEPIKALTPEQSRQLKYIRQAYSLLSRDDYAKILKCDIRSINYTLDYPTTTYIRYGLDESIKDKVESYINTRYPYMLASEVEELVMV